MAVDHTRIDILANEILALKLTLTNIPSDAALKQRIANALGTTVAVIDSDPTLQATVDTFVTDSKAQLTTFLNSEITSKTLEIKKLTDDPPTIEFFDPDEVADGDLFQVTEVNDCFAFDEFEVYFDAGDISVDRVNVGTYSFDEGTTKFILVP